MSDTAAGRLALTHVRAQITNRKKFLRLSNFEINLPRRGKLNRSQAVNFHQLLKIRYLPSALSRPRLILFIYTINLHLEYPYSLGPGVHTPLLEGTEGNWRVRWSEEDEQDGCQIVPFTLPFVHH